MGGISRGGKGAIRWESVAEVETTEKIENSRVLVKRIDYCYADPRIACPPGAPTYRLQMGLCFETLRKGSMAGESYRQAWKTLLEQRAERKESRENEKDEALRDAARADGRGGDSGKGKGTYKALNIGGGGGGRGGDDDCDDDGIGMILLQARMALTTISDSRGSSAAASGWLRGSTPQQQQFEGGMSGLQTGRGRPSSPER